MLEPDLPTARATMLDHLRRHGVTAERVIAAMGAVSREEFVAAEDHNRAYDDTPLSIGFQQTISQPLMVGLLVQALELNPGERVLDVGTGSGYQAAVLAACGARVTSIEIIEELATSARERLRRLGVDVDVQCGDGGAGVPGEEPFDGIVVAAAAPQVPVLLLRQLAQGGRLVVPIRKIDMDQLIRIRRTGEGWQTDDLGPCRFVPLRGEEGIQPDAE